MENWRNAINLFLTRHPESSHENYYTQNMWTLICDNDSDDAADEAWDEMSAEKKGETDKEAFLDAFYELPYQDSRSVLNFKLTQEDAKFGDGDGSQQHVVYKLENTITNEHCFVMFTGERSSWDRDYWDDDPQLVESYEVTVKKWRKVK